MVGKAPLVWALCIGASVGSRLVSVAYHSDSVERRLVLAHRCIPVVEKRFETYSCTHLAETCFVVRLHIDAAAAARVLAAPSSELFLDGSDTISSQ